MIRRYREMHVSHWDEIVAVPGLGPLLERLNSLCPTPREHAYHEGFERGVDIRRRPDALAPSGI